MAEAKPLCDQTKVYTSTTSGIFFLIGPVITSVFFWICGYFGLNPFLTL